MVEVKRKRFTSESLHIRTPATVACTVCMNSLSNGDKITRLPCHHYFHRRCIKGWLSSNKTCPICRRVVLVPKRPHTLRVRENQVGVTDIRVSHVNYRRPLGLCVDQLIELIKTLFFNRDGSY
ncbi:putative transcription factor C2H2 family [Helianthus annuus]|nr:putative transcription factor C2H2 family [Helianthus annuus]